MMTTKLVRELIDAIKAVVYEPYEEGKRVKNGQLVLTEDSSSASCQTVTFNIEETNKILVYKFDKSVRNSNNETIEDPLPIFEAGKARAKPDYIVFYEYYRDGNPLLYVVICNMKSGNAHNNDEQLMAGSALGEYILKTAVRRFAKDNAQNSAYASYGYKELAPYFKFKEIVISNTAPAKKGTTNPKKSKKSVYSLRTHVKCGQTHILESKIRE